MLQIRLYSAAYEAIYGKLPHLASLRGIGISPGGVSQIDIRPGRKDVDAAIKVVTETRVAMESGSFDPKPSAFTCSGCPYIPLCPEVAL